MCDPIVSSLVVTRRVVGRFGTRSSQSSPNLPDCWRRDLRAGPHCRSDTARCRSPADRFLSGFRSWPERVTSRSSVRGIRRSRMLINPELRVIRLKIRRARLRRVRGSGALSCAPRGWGGPRCGAVRWRFRALAIVAVPVAVSSAVAVAVLSAVAVPRLARVAVAVLSRSSMQFGAVVVAVCGAVSVTSTRSRLELSTRTLSISTVTEKTTRSSTTQSSATSDVSPICGRSTSRSVVSPSMS